MGLIPKNNTFKLILWADMPNNVVFIFFCRANKIPNVQHHRNYLAENYNAAIRADDFRRNVLDNTSGKYGR